MEVAAGFAPDDLARDRFAGSAGAIQRVLEKKTSVVVSDAAADPFLSQRPSVVGMGLGALACVPMRHEGEILGMIYVDGRERAAGFAELDLEILESLAEHAAMVVASLRLQRRIRDAWTPVALHGGDPVLLAELQRRIAEFLTGAAAAPAGDLPAL